MILFPASLFAQDGKLRVIVFGAHPDDCDMDVGGTAILFSKMGHAVKFVAVTNGDAGHQTMKGKELAKRRLLEAKEAGKRFGVSYDVLDNHDGQLVPSLDVRLQIIGKIREWNADIVIAPRPNDYHPDHLHGVLAIAAIKKGKHVLMHKPLSNRLAEGKKVIGHAKSSNVITHLVPWDSNGSMEKVMEWINSGAIGTLKEVHNWTNRPVWPQYAELPKEKPPVPKGFNWDLWLGPEAERPYHPSYTHMLFRGWYDFGGGSMADMGHYSLWTVFNALKLTSPTVVEPCRSHVCDFHGQVPYQIKNDFSFPMACMVTFRYPANGNRPPVDLCWYDGGMRPATPVELAKDNKELPAEGMMFIGDKGKILAGFRVEDPEILGKPESKQTTKEIDNEIFAKYHLDLFVKACQSGKQYPGTFAESEYLTEAVNLYAVALRTNHNLHFDAAKQVTNLPEANKYLSREYRPGWNPDTI